MKLTMKEILNKYSDCDMFSLTGTISDCYLREEDFLGALEKKKIHQREQLKKFYIL